MRATSRLAVHLEPLEPLLFGDNRSARAGADRAQADQDPTPATLYGAIGGAIARHLGATGEAGWGAAEPILGPFHRELSGGPADRAELLGYARCDVDGALWLPRPEHLFVRRFEGGSAAHDLLAPGPRPDREEGVLGSLPLARRLRGPDAREVREAEGELWVDEELLGAALTGGELPAAGRIVGREHFERAEQRLGLGMRNQTNTAEEGLLFNRPYRRFRSGASSARQAWCGAGYRAWFGLVAPLADAAAASGIGFFGGDRGRARLVFEELDGEAFSGLRSAVLAACDMPSDGLLAYLLTPLVARAELPALGGSRPLAPLAAAVGHPYPVSGWRGASSRYGPRRMRTLLPAGSVFFYPWPQGCGAADGRRRLIEELWCQPLDESYRHAGFGRALPGIWRAR